MRPIDADALMDALDETWKAYDGMVWSYDGTIMERMLGMLWGLEKAMDVVTGEQTVDAVVLPCNVGDTVYRVITEPSGCDFDGEMERCGGCRYVDMPCDDVLRYDPFEWGCGFKPHVEAMPFFSCMVDMIGKTVFLTREAAEAALEERRGEG